MPRWIDADHQRPVNACWISQPIDVRDACSIAYAVEINLFKSHAFPHFFCIIDDIHHCVTVDIRPLFLHPLEGGIIRPSQLFNVLMGKWIFFHFHRLGHLRTIERNRPIHTSISNHDYIMTLQEPDWRRLPDIGLPWPPGKQEDRFRGILSCGMYLYYGKMNQPGIGIIPVL